MEATVTDSEQHPAGADPAHSRIEAERESDDRVDTWAILVIFVSAILFAVHFISSGQLI
jgi:hypothetical protein